MTDPLAHLDGSEGAIAQRLREMVRIPTVNPPGRSYREMVEWLCRWCKSIDMGVEIHRVPDADATAAGVDAEYPRFNLIARWDVGAQRTVHFNAHYDVVPASGRWRFGGPFEPHVSGGWLYGRGSGDMKGSIAALLSALEAIRRARAEPAFNIECSFTADEETGGQLGAGWVVRQGLVNADLAVVCEGASGTRVGCGHNGVLWMEVEVQGKSAHASNPDQGINAFEGMAEMVHQLQSVKRSLSSSSRQYRDVSGGTRQPTINLGGVFGGNGLQVNTVPGDALFSIDRRVLPNERLTQVEEELRRALARAASKGPGIRYRTRSTLRIDPCVVDSDHELPRAFARSVRAVRRRAASYRLTTGFTDLHYFVREGGLPGIGYGVDGHRAHAVDERLKTRDLVQTAKTYAHFILRDI